MFKPGEISNPKGRPTGTKNRSSVAIRKAYSDLIEGNLDNITTWLDETAKKDPARAIELLVKLTGFVLPKLNKTDVTSLGEKINIILPRPKDTESINE